MRCTCQKCGEYMVQDEKGIFSRCICPNCLNTCDACLGTRQKPVGPEELREILRMREIQDRAREDEPDGPFPEERF